jgi:hypothetical protein
MLQQRRESLDRGTWLPPVAWNQPPKYRTRSTVSSDEGSEGGSYDFVPICYDSPWLRPGRDSFSQMGSDNASARNGRNHINLRKNAQFIQAAKRTKMKQGSPEPASREAQRQSLSPPPRFMWNEGSHQRSFDSLHRQRRQFPARPGEVAAGATSACRAWTVSSQLSKRGRRRKT